MGDQSTRRRVKLYALNAERQWDDRGTGHVTSSYVEKLQGVSLLVKAEADGSVLLESKIQPETIYQKQQETLIVWSEGDNFDLALSFQERAGCDEIWEKICQVQGRDPSVEITHEAVEESEDERFDDMSDTVPSIELPAAEMARLEEISELINSCLHSAIKREKLTLAVEADNYIPKLMRMFQMCEDLENTAGLHHLHDIIINLFQLNKNALIESMFKIDVIFDVVGCLEYDPANPVPTRHREYLRQMANFKQVLPIRNSELLAKIHQTYRVQYIQDIVLPTPSVLEDNVLSTLSSFIFFNKLDIVRQLQDDEKFLTEFFALLSDEKTPITKRRDLVMFLKEFCSFSQTLQPQSKETFFKTLLSLGVLQALETTLTVDAGPLSQPGQVIKSACIDILMYIVETVPSMVREHMLQQAETCDDDQLLMNLLVDQMVCDRDPEVGSAVQLSGIIRILIDPDNMMAALNRSEKTEFFAFFYKRCMHCLVEPLINNTTNKDLLHDDPATVQLLNLVLELLSFCVEHHTFHAKNYIMNKDIVVRILVLMKSKHKYLALDALRFLRKMVALKDDNYNRHIVKNNLFAPVVEAFFNNQGRYNLLDSAVIELFEFIKTEDIKMLLAYIVETFGDKLLDVTYVQTFRNLKQRYEQQQDRLQQRTAALESVPSILRGTTRYRRDPRQLDEDEEMWFNDEDDYEDGGEPAPVAGLHGLHGSAAAVSDLEQIGKMIEGRSKLFSPSGGDLCVEKTAASAEPACGGVNGAAAAAKLGLVDSAPTAGSPTASPTASPTTSPTPAAAPAAAAAGAATDGVCLVKKVGLVDYDADSDEEEEEGAAISPLLISSLVAAATTNSPVSPSAAAAASAPVTTGAMEPDQSQTQVTTTSDSTAAEPAATAETADGAVVKAEEAPAATESTPPVVVGSVAKAGAVEATQERSPAVTTEATPQCETEVSASAPADRTEVAASTGDCTSTDQNCAEAGKDNKPVDQDDSVADQETPAVAEESVTKPAEVVSEDEKGATAKQNGEVAMQTETALSHQETAVDAQESAQTQQEAEEPVQQESTPQEQKTAPVTASEPSAAAEPAACSDSASSQDAPADQEELSSASAADQPAGSPADQQQPPPAAEVARSPPRGQQSPPPDAGEHRDADQLPSAKRPRLEAS
ncbi:serine/threonine-protein phosphatase 4 regulatory subunit 3-like [Amphibalanus amphitrite]|uniref:serine/threonine-protein phosphatase 4 regulatory subunit 3-like n=1 Tax=Amphibalanus amphitrite TaxID=1232801 RepID=UPI001C91FA23|nr:serine/threonine-protein phosphatase 4 regulatory subunit 3-like [Amphibalanus amphitrite]